MQARWDQKGIGNDQWIWEARDVAKMTEAMEQGSGLPFELALIKYTDGEARLMSQYTQAIHPNFDVQSPGECYPGRDKAVYVGLKRCASPRNLIISISGVQAMRSTSRANAFGVLQGSTRSEVVSG